MFDLRRIGKVCMEVNYEVFVYMQQTIGEVYRGLDLTITTYPEDDIVDSAAYLTAINASEAGDAMTIFLLQMIHILL